MPIQNQVAIKEGKLKKNKASNYISVDTRRLLIKEAVAKGMKFSDIVDKYSQEWNVGYRTMQQYVALAMKDLYNDETTEVLRQINLERLDTIVAEQMNKEDYKNAVKTIDIQNKTANVYKEKVEIDDTNITFELKF